MCTSPCVSPLGPPLQYLPNFYFGALLLWFGIEISWDWLIHSFHKLSRTEYVLLLATFLATVQLGLELGIGIGIVMATLFFAFAYARVSAGRAGRPGRRGCAQGTQLLQCGRDLLQLVG